MTSNEILKADVIDILFDNRNKQYGAYTLRKNYNARLTLSLFLALAIASLLFFFMQINKSGELTLGPIKPDVVLRDLVVPELRQPEPKRQLSAASQPPVRQTKLIDNIQIVDRDVREAVPPTNVDMGMISAVTVAGPPSDGNGFTPGLNTGVGKSEPAADKPADPPLQREPEFPGGTKAWIDFLQKNLMPPSTMDEGEKKTVLIRFQVASDGSVTNFEVVQSAGKMFDNEVIRVLKKMPKWKPAIQNNLPVARSFTQPVTFMGIGD
jgi:protein TonB